jgi:DNA-directed RNA polymerase subunit RPC12/RpoP
MTIKFYTKLINSIEKIDTVTLDEKHDKADTIIAITKIISKRGGSVHWVKGKWKVAETSFQCGSCENEFKKPKKNSCPHCGSGNFVEGTID